MLQIVTNPGFEVTLGTCGFQMAHADLCARIPDCCVNLSSQDHLVFLSITKSASDRACSCGLQAAFVLKLDGSSHSPQFSPQPLRIINEDLLPQLWVWRKAVKQVQQVRVVRHDASIMRVRPVCAQMQRSSAAWMNMRANGIASS